MTETDDYTWVTRALDEWTLDWLDDLAERLDDIRWASRGDWDVPQQNSEKPPKPTRGPAASSF